MQVTNGDTNIADCTDIIPVTDIMQNDNITHNTIINSAEIKQNVAFTINNVTENGSEVV